MKKENIMRLVALIDSIPQREAELEKAKAAAEQHFLSSEKLNLAINAANARLKLAKQGIQEIIDGKYWDDINSRFVDGYRK